MSNRLFGRSELKRSWGRRIRIDSWERLQLVVDLIKSTLPEDISMDLDDAAFSRQPAPPLPYDPGIGRSVTVPTPLAFLAEVRVSLCIDKTLAWLLPVQFCIDQLLTAEEVVTRLSDAVVFLKAWSQVHAQEGREHLRAQSFQAQRSANSPNKYLIQ